MGLIVDNFAGGGGASLGIEMALGRPIDIAINHDPAAIAMHAANHPETEHLCQNVWQIDPADIAKRGPIDLAWFSPDCKHFSKAKGGRPLNKNIRDLAWVVVLWAQRARPAVIMLENVEEFRQWGPLDGEGKPLVNLKGMTFKRWVRQLEKLGYQVEWRERRACDSGASTIRKRLFVIARCDGKPIIWPEPTHGEGKLPYRTAADIIDWTLPCPSIFLGKEEGRAQGVRRPLAPNTMRRIARGVEKFVLKAADPFIVYLQQGGAVRDIHDPLHTVTASRKDCNLVVMPHLSRQFGNSIGSSIGEPAGTVTAGGGGKSALVAAFLAQHNTGVIGRDARDPLSTTTQRGTNQAVVAAHLSNFYMSNTNGGQGDLREPMTTITAGGNHQALVSAFLTKYHRDGGQWARCDEPMHTLDTRDRMGLVTVNIDGVTFVITDIGMRMLVPREQFRAQGFPDTYIIDPIVNGKPMTKTAQTRCCGNSVSPPQACDQVRANLVKSATREAA